MRRGLVAAAALAVFAVTARADGVILPSRALVAPIRTPDQRALIAFDGKTETIVVETTLAGAGRDFAWIVPLPAVPNVEASTTGLFPTLEILTAPRVNDRSKSSLGWAAPAALGLLAVAVFLASRGLRAALAAGIGLLVAIPAVCAVGGPGCAKEADSDASAGPRELSREQVGCFDVTTVDPGDGSGLRRWLDERGFVAPPAVDAVAADYARRGWVFVAAKLRSDSETAEVRRVHPLAFTFASATAVYPMRLTLAANPSCALELFAFGDGTAESEGMTVAFSGAPLVAADHPHAEITKRAIGRHATKLVGTLDAASVHDDLVLRWAPPRSVGTELWTLRAVADRANEFGAWVALAGGLLASIALGSWRRAPSPHSILTRALVYGVAACAGIATTAVVWRTTPRLPADARRVFERSASLGSRVAAHLPDTAHADLAAARAWMTDWVANAEHDPDGNGPREQDSPGNYTLRETGGRIELVEYDGRGRETVTDLSKPR